MSEQVLNIASVLSGFSTVVIAFLTLFLWLENRALRKAGSEPRVVAHFEPHADGTGGLNISLSNVGTGPALDVSMSISGDHEDFKKYQLIQNPFSKQLKTTVIPQGDKFSFLFAVGFQLFRPKDSKDKDELVPLKPFFINVTWHSFGSNKTHSENYKLDVSELSGIAGIVNKPYLLKIADNLDLVAKQLGGLKPHIQHIGNLIETSTIESHSRNLALGNKEPTSSDDNIQS